MVCSSFFRYIFSSECTDFIGFEGCLANEGKGFNEEN